jgi:hypothetical protein
MIRIFVSEIIEKISLNQRRAFLNHGLERFYGIIIYSDLKQSKAFVLRNTKFRDTFIKFFAIKFV